MQNKFAWSCVFAALVLSGCGSDEKPPLQGERISVLQLQNTLEVDQTAKDVALELPEAKNNTAWPQAGGNATHTPGHIALNTNLKKAWSVNIGEGSEKDRKLITAPVVAYDMVFASDTEGHVSAYKLADGKKLWTVEVVTEDEEESVTVSSGLTFGNGKLFVSNGLGTVLALNPNNGEKLWSTKLEHPARGAPTFQAGRLYIITLSDETVALGAEKGDVLWTHKGIEESAGLLGAPSPAAEGSVVITIYSSGDVVALRAETGQEAWSDNLTGMMEANKRAVTQLSGFRGHPVLDGDHVIIGNNASRTIDVHVPSGERAWQKEFGSAQTPWVAGNVIYMLTSQNELICIVKETGQVRWSTALARFEDPDDREDPILWNGPILAGGRLLVAGSNEKMLGINPEDGKIISEADLPGNAMLPPVVAQNTLLILTDEGQLVAYR